MEFSGFQRGTLCTPVPNPLLGPLLEQIQDLAELKVTLRALWLLHRRRSWPPQISLAEFLNDGVLCRGLRAGGGDPRVEIRRGLEMAVQRGTLLQHQPGDRSSGVHLYLLNTPANRSLLSRWKRDGQADDTGNQSHTGSAPGWTPVIARPNIFALYEDNIGMLAPMLADQLKEAEEVYPPSWIEEAFQIAVSQNKRNWRYIEAILRRWAEEGRTGGPEDGKPRRYSPKDNRQRYIEEYKRRRGRLPWETGESRGTDGG